MATSNVMLIGVLFILGYIVLYVGGRKYLEAFESKEKRFRGDGTPNTKATLPELPYTMKAIDKLDEYEISDVYNNRGSKEASKKQISDAMTRYPMDWPSRGPDSQTFQEGQAQFKNEMKNAPAPATNFYREVDGSDMKMPDTYEIDDEERKILQTYQPKDSKGLLQYSVQDVKHLLHKVYDKKGLIPVINKSEQGENVWEITEVREKDPKIVWENDMNSTRNTMIDRGEEVIQVPIATSDVAAGLDPFFQPRDKVSQNKYDYTQWTPGMERMFAPTYPVKSWF